MTQAKNGDTVKVHYTGTLEDGTQFDSSVGSDPLQFTIGSGQIIPGFENCVKQLTVGEKTTITIPPEEAYGQKRDDLIQQVDKSHLPPDIELKIGLMLQAQQADGNMVNLMVTEIGEDMITVDANPPLAGKALVFEIELVEIV